MKKVILGIVLLSQFVYGMSGTPEFTNASEMRRNNFVRVDSFKTFPLYGSEEYSALIGANDESAAEGTIWKFIRGLGGYNTETGKNALNTVLLSHKYLNALINSDNLSWENLKSLVDAESNEDKKAWAVYSAFAKALIDQHDRDKEDLIRNVKKQQKDILESIATQYNEKLKRMEETSEQKESLLQEMIDELTAVKSKLEKERELCERVREIFKANLSLKPEKISIRSDDVIQEMDVRSRYGTVKSYYDKFTLFSDLLGREDLGVEAKQSDLAKIFEYLNNTRINKKPDTPKLIRDASIHEETRSSSSFFSSSYYHCVTVTMPDEKFLKDKYRNIPGSGGLEWYNRCKDIENTERRNAYNNAISAWNAEIARASSVLLPSEEFDRLVEQFNFFVSKQ